MSGAKEISPKLIAFFRHRDAGFTDAVLFERGDNGAIEIFLESGGGVGPDTYDREIDECGLDRDDVRALIEWLRQGAAPVCDTCGIEIADATTVIKCGRCARVPLSKL